MKENIYEAPFSEVRAIGANKRIYSPNQILGGVFLGGPLAAIFFLRHNFLLLGKLEYAYRTLAIGSVLMLLIMGIIVFIPENFPNTFLPIIYCLIAKQIAVSMQLKKIQIVESEEYTFVSNWNVIGVGILALVLFLVMFIVLILALNFLGFTILT